MTYAAATSSGSTKNTAENKRVSRMHARFYGGGGAGGCVCVCVFVKERDVN